VLVGRSLLRDASTHELLLKNGLPIADQSGVHVLSTVEPDWRAGLTNTIRMGGLELSVLVDGQIGGHLFSATNQLGQRGGTLIQTANRPDSGLIIAGIDSATGQANTKHVSTQDYFHALGAVQEPWVYDASFLKLRDARVSYVIPLTAVPGLRAQTARVSLIGRNLAVWSKVPNIDPETALSTTAFQGIELGQLPSVRSIGLQLTLTP
jgi:hypothetical protein